MSRLTKPSATTGRATRPPLGADRPEGCPPDTDVHSGLDPHVLPEGDYEPPPCCGVKCPSRVWLAASCAGYPPTVLRRWRILLLGCALLLMTSVASAAPPDNATTLSFAAAGDFSFTGNAAAVLQKIDTEQPDLALALGDLSYGATGAGADLVRLRHGAGGRRVSRSSWCPGNHESNGHNGNINDFSACLPNQLPGVVGTYGRQYYVDVPQTTRWCGS